MSAEEPLFPNAGAAWDFVNERAGLSDIEGEATFDETIQYLRKEVHLPYPVVEELTRKQQMAMNMLDQIDENERLIVAICGMIAAVEPDRLLRLIGVSESIEEWAAVVGQQHQQAAALAKIADDSAKRLETYWQAVASVRLVCARERER